jgi:hypothetical protein
MRVHNPDIKQSGTIILGIGVLGFIFSKLSSQNWGMKDKVSVLDLYQILSAGF